jgi:hypothetical protein
MTYFEINISKSMKLGLVKWFIYTMYNIFVEFYEIKFILINNLL